MPAALFASRALRSCCIICGGATTFGLFARCPHSLLCHLFAPCHPFAPCRIFAPCHLDTLHQFSVPAPSQELAPPGLFPGSGRWFHLSWDLPWHLCLRSAGVYQSTPCYMTYRWYANTTYVKSEEEMHNIHVVWTCLYIMPKECEYTPICFMQLWESNASQLTCLPFL